MAATGPSAAPDTVDKSDAAGTNAEFAPKSQLEVDSLESAAKVAYTPKDTFDLDATEQDETVTVTKTDDGSTETVQVEVDESDESDEDLPDFDIHLREALRIMADWVELGEQSERSASLAATASSDQNG